MKEKSQLEDIMDLYLTKKQVKPDTASKEVTPYVIQYLKMRESGLQHHPTMQIMYMEHLGVEYLNRLKQND